ncbi:orotidine-5'-phosphate decarboxylase [Lujinxingia litoralis]|uniref:Orotidine 5'-phosphate decarboxylase n=1 Tax=Lujinxingia litoralis TaxID=2211119 RepID=A0A328CA38_9DELT|nr:orotidine-5'-phosphate decarboxylase [Lujinxingia litoralis]RAL23854.1 orotidine-5'-phosphate decarboxylase [Lujinxingia litoralis]
MNEEAGLRADELVRQRVVAALDFDTIEEAVALVDLLQDRVTRFKVGMRLFTRYGPAILDALAEREAQVFLDLKFHDIPSVVADACAAAAAHPSVFMLTVHASGGQAMMRHAARGAKRGRPDSPPLVVAVTALTSLKSRELPSFGVGMGVRDWAEKLGALALKSGVDGVVCSAHEAEGLRTEVGARPVLVTPGIRLEDVHIAGDDQARTMTPGRAMAAGSSYLVIGRPIYQSPDPIAAVDAVSASVASWLEKIR